MTQNEFFNILMDGLKDFPEIKLQDIISYYKHNFTLGLAAGKTEDEIIHELGEPNSIVTKCRNEYFNIYSNSKLSTDNDDETSNGHTNFNESPDINAHTNLNDTNNIIIGTFGTNSSENVLKNANELSRVNDDFYELHNSNIASDGKESNSQNNTEKILNENFNSNNTQNSSTFSNNFTKKNFTRESSQINVNTILRICIVVLTLIIFFPVITGIIGFFIGLFGLAISIFVASIGVLIGGTFTSIIGLPNVPAFVANFPYPVIVLFSLGSISLSILLILLFYYFCKFFIRVFIKFYNSLKNKGGAF